MTHEDLRIDGDRLLRRISDLAAIGPIDGGGSCRLALTDEDRDGRDLVVTWMHDLGLDVAVDGIGNVVAVRPGRTALARPVSRSIFSQCPRSFRPGAFLLGVSGASVTAAYGPRPAIEIPCSASLARRLYGQVCRMGL